VRHRLLLISILAVSGAMLARADDVIPQRLAFSRYEAMVKSSPFAIASAPVPAATAPSWSKDLFVANAAHTSEVDLVTVMSLSDKNMKEYLSTEGPNKDGYAIANIEWSDSPGETKVTISKNGQFATLGFNETFLEQQARPGVPVTAPMITGKPGFQPGFQTAPPPGQAFPTPHVRGVIPRKPRGEDPPTPVTPTLSEPPPLPPGQ
jgi:hypothetical protein